MELTSKDNQISPFAPNAPFLYCPENRKGFLMFSAFLMFSGSRERMNWNKLVKTVSKKEKAIAISYNIAFMEITFC